MAEFPTPEFTLVKDQAALASVVRELSSGTAVGIDCETTGLNPRVDRTRILTIASGGGVWLIDCWAVDPSPIFPALAKCEVIGHNLLFDLAFLGRLGMVAGRCADTLLLARLLSCGLREAEVRGYHTLASVAERELGRTLPKELQLADWGGALSAEMLRYAARDAAILLPLRDALMTRIAEAGLDGAAELENRCLPAIVWMSRNGAPFDTDTWLRLADDAEREGIRLAAELDEAAPKEPGTLDLGQGWDWNSPEAAMRALKLAGCEVPDSRDDTLAAAGHPLAELLRRHRAAAKLNSTYGRNWLEHVSDGRVWADWVQMGAWSGRMACRNPNLQNVPRDPRYRACIAAPPGKLLIKADYSQIELRIAASIAQDAAMIGAYLRGEDLHVLTARQLTGKEEISKSERQLAKAVNFGLLYGMGARGFRAYAAGQYGVQLSEQESEQYRDAFFRAYPGIRRWHLSQSRRPESIRTLTGRRRLGVERFTEKLNGPVQGTGADGLKRAMALLWERRGECPGALLVLACHDELVVECGENEAARAAAWLRSAMVDGMAPLIAPVPVEIELQTGRTWSG